MTQNPAASALAAMLNARSVAVVGASDDRRKLSYATLHTLIEGGYEGKLYPVNPRGGMIQGLTAYPSISAIPDRIDLAVVVVPAPAVPAVLREAAAKGATGAIVHSGGFRESGRADLEAELARVVQETGLRVVGPNVQGVIHTPNKLCAVFWPVVYQVGSIGVVSQSGTITGALCDWANDDGLGLSAAINLGNQVDFCESDALDYLATDSHTKAIALYLEGARDGRRFLETAARVSRSKPVVVLKSGRTAGGAAATASHTGALAGVDEVFNGACRQYGLIRAQDTESLYDSAKALAALGTHGGRRLLIITTSGGTGAVAVDEAELCGLAVSRLPHDLVAELRQLSLPQFASFKNPVDMAMVAAEPFRDIALAADRYDAADVMLLIFGDPTPGAAEAAKETAARVKASVVAVCFGGGNVEKVERAKMHAAGIPVFPTPERAIRAIAAAVRYADFRRELQGAA